MSIQDLINKIIINFDTIGKYVDSDNKNAFTKMLATVEELSNNMQELGKVPISELKPYKDQVISVQAAFLKLENRLLTTQSATQKEMQALVKQMQIKNSYKAKK